jgi:hypothetical protein
MDNQFIGILAFIVLILIFVVALTSNKNIPFTKKELIDKANKRFQKQINNYRLDVPIADEDPFKSSKYSSQKILKARERITEIKQYWKENKEKLKEMPFMSDELYKSTDNELNN